MIQQNQKKNELVYKIYGLNEKEIEIVEKLPIGRKKQYITEGKEE